MQFSETLHALKEFVDAPGIDCPGARILLVPADRTTHVKRLGRLARRYPNRETVLAALEPESSNAFGLPADALCSGPSWDI